MAKRFFKKLGMALMIGVLGKSLAAGAAQITLIAGLRELLNAADAVAAVEILRVDDTATAADGPLILEVKVISAPKGEMEIGQTLRTWESAQIAGTYEVGQHRLLLLRRQRVVEPYHRKAAWWNMPIGLAVFIEETSLEQLTMDALSQWIHELSSDNRVQPSVAVHREKDLKDKLKLTITLMNTTHDQAIQLSRSCVQITFDAAQRHFVPPINWNDSEAPDWRTIGVGELLSGTAMVDVALPYPVSMLPVQIGHMCLKFPFRHTWVGAYSTEVAL